MSDTTRRDSDRTEKQTEKHADQRTAQPSQTGQTSGTNRDFDESGESINQGHGHPREERTQQSKR